MSIIRILEPAAEPLGLAEVKTHLRLDVDTQENDDLLRRLISTARRNCEAKTGRSLITQQWRLSTDAFPCGPLLLERGPVQAVNAINWIDMSGALQTVQNPGLPDYASDLRGSMPRLAPAFGRIWPSAAPQLGSVWVDYTTGYGAQASAVPSSLRDWMLLRVATLYENPEENVTGISLTPLPHVDSLLDDERIWLA